MQKVLIVGAGLSGLMTAYLLARNADVDVTVLECGNTYDSRLRSTKPNLVSGVGGAGTVFGGKLCLPPASGGVWRHTDYSHERFFQFEQKCLNSFGLECSDTAQETTLRKDYMQHGVGEKSYHSVLVKKEKMNAYVKQLLTTLDAHGVKIKTNCRFLGYRKSGQKFLANYSESNTLVAYSVYDVLIMATGRFSAGRMENLLGKDVLLRKQSPDLGFRFSMQLQEDSTFGSIGKDVKLKAQISGIGIRTFCVCSGGDKTIVDLHGTRYYDGHFVDEISDLANVGVLARSPKIVGNEMAYDFCRHLEKYLSADLTLKDFVKYHHKLISDTHVYDELLGALSTFVKALSATGAIEGNLDEYPMWLPSVDRLNSYVMTDSHFETNVSNLFVIGDAAGISRGFVQSLWSAYCASEGVLHRLSEEVYTSSPVAYRIAV